MIEFLMVNDQLGLQTINNYLIILICVPLCPTINDNVTLFFVDQRLTMSELLGLSFGPGAAERHQLQRGHERLREVG